MLTSLAIALLTAAGTPATAAPRIWLDYSDEPTALKVANDTGAEVRNCKVEWTIRWDRDRHYTEIAFVDLPARGEVQVSDCHEWWNLSWSKTMDVSVALYGPDGAALAKQEYAGIFKLVARAGLPTAGWTATASRGGNPAAAFDGDLATRWDTGGKQQVGDWYMLDLGKAQRFAGLVLDSRGSSNDYPSGFTVYISDDGRKWTRLADLPDAEPLNRGGKITLSFDPVTARYLNLTLTRTHSDTWFWSIHELSVLPPKGE